MSHFARPPFAILVVVLALASWLPPARSQQRPAEATIETWKKAGASYGAIDPLTLDFTQVPVPPPTNLPAFHFANPPATAADLPAVEVPFALRCVRSCSAILKGIARQKQLRLLDLSQSTVTEAELSHLAGLRLIGLKLPVAATSDAALRHYLAAREPAAAELDLQRWQITDAALKELSRPKFAKLESLSLNGTKITDGGLKALAGLTELRSLDLFSTGITDTGLAALGKLKKLTSLNLAGTKITDEGLKQLAGLTELRSLYLSGTSVTDAGLPTLAKFQKLESLSLANTKVTEAGGKKLGDLNLKSLVLPKKWLPELRTTECTGDACTSLSWKWDGSCVAATNVGRVPIEVHYTEKVWSSSESKTNLVPGTSVIPPAASVRLGKYCFRTYQDIGPYRATFNPNAAPSPPRTAAQGPIADHEQGRPPAASKAPPSATSPPDGGSKPAADKPPPPAEPAGKPVYGPFNPTGVTSSPPLDRTKQPPRKSAAPRVERVGNWTISNGSARQREAIKHSANVKIGARAIKVMGALVLTDNGVSHTRQPKFEDINASLNVGGDLLGDQRLIVGKEIRVTLDDREVARATLQAERNPWIRDRVVVNHFVSLKREALKSAKSLKATIVVDGSEQVFYEDALEGIEEAFSALQSLGPSPK